LLDCLRLTLQLANDLNRDDGLLEAFKAVVEDIAKGQGPMNDSTKYVRRCLTSMTNIKEWLKKLVDKLNSASLIGGGQQEELKEATEYQRVSLVEQHESLGVIVLYLVKMGFSSTADFEVVLETLRTADKYDHLLRKFNSLFFRAYPGPNGVLVGIQDIKSWDTFQHALVRNVRLN
jgi:nuclear pore complex protein Nup205